jgi:hypothetical protein
VGAEVEGWVCFITTFSWSENCIWYLFVFMGLPGNF